MMFGVKQDVPNYEGNFETFRNRNQIIQIIQAAYAIMSRPITGVHPMK
jgi:hypothetical protein